MFQVGDPVVFDPDSRWNTEPFTQTSRVYTVTKAWPNGLQVEIDGEGPYYSARFKPVPAESISGSTQEIKGE